MQNKFVWSFLSLVTLATGGLLGGCDSDAKIAKSSAGESCDKTSDCDEGLKCLQGTCYKGSSSSGGSANNAGGDGTGATDVGPTPPVLGKLGESCTKRADCVDGLACLSQRCSEDVAVGAGGEGTGGPALGGVGETCGLTSDCQDGLACLPTVNQDNRTAEAKALGANSIGTCSPVDNGLTPTGNSCQGAECKTAEDCCELPVAVHVAYSVATPYGTGANSCIQLAALLDGVNCATTKVVAQQVQCFAQAAYCECGAKAWACTEAGKCEYTAACVAATNGPVTGGCAAYSRTGQPLTQLCNKAKKCVAEAVAGCETDADCDETVLVAEQTEYCTDGKCVCNTENGACYRGCAEDLDCPVTYTCDTKASLCRKSDYCTSDAFCVTRTNDINAKCNAGTCQTSCNNDLDCNYGQLTNGPSTMVCNAQHQCEAFGCESDDECPAVGGVRTFCTKTQETVATGGVVSAVTD